MILTIDQAFRGVDFLVIQKELRTLASRGVYDPNFTSTVEDCVKSKEARQNCSAIPQGPATLVHVSTLQ